MRFLKLHSNWYNDCKNYVWHPYRQSDTTPNLAVKKVKGCLIYLQSKITTNKSSNYIIQNWIKKSKSKILLDGISSWWSVCHGYSNKNITKSIIKQLRDIPHVMFSGLSHKYAYLLAKELCDFSKINGKVFFTDSGSVAIEVAIKIAFQYFKNLGLSNKNQILSFYANYHGDTIGAMSVSGCDGFNSVFYDFLPKHPKLHLPKNEEDFYKFEEFLSKNESTICGVLIEPILQGAGGMLVYSIQNLQRLCDIIRKYNILIIFDECATGFYRLGKPFAFHFLQNITPDIITLSKALSGGFIGLGACVVSQKIALEFSSDDSQKTFMHGPTFMANPIACVAAYNSLKLFYKKDYSVIVKQIEDSFKANLEGINKFSIVNDVRIFGAVACVEIKNVIDIFYLRSLFIKRCVWIRPIYTADDNIAIYLMPSFIITKDQIAILTNAIFDVIEDVDKNFR
jgi:adenosylmethionine-8-amino-7-oxononanoate aminotransferase